MLSLGKGHLGSLNTKRVLQISPVAGLPAAKSNSGQICLLFRQPASGSTNHLPSPPIMGGYQGWGNNLWGRCYIPQGSSGTTEYGVLCWCRGVCIRVETQMVSEGKWRVWSKDGLGAGCWPIWITCLIFVSVPRFSNNITSEYTFSQKQLWWVSGGFSI